MGRLMIMAGMLAVLVVSGESWAADMELTLDDGRLVILHEDSTWGFAKFSISDGDEEDIYITVDGGKTLCLKTDNTWNYSKVQQPRKKSVKELPAIQASGAATKPMLDQAVQAATEEAIRRAAERLKPYSSKKTTAAHKCLLACIKAEVGDHGAEVTYKPGWSAQAKVSLDKFQVKKIITCADDQLAAQTAEASAPAVSAEKTAPAAKTE